MTVPVFVQIDKSREALNSLDRAKTLLLQLKELTHKLHDLRVQENRELHIVEMHATNLHHRIQTLDKHFVIK